MTTEKDGPILVEEFRDDVTVDRRDGSESYPCYPYPIHTKGARVLVRFKGKTRFITVSRSRGHQFEQEISQEERAA